MSKKHKTVSKLFWTVTYFSLKRLKKLNKRLNKKFQCFDRW